MILCISAVSVINVLIHFWLYLSLLCFFLSVLLKAFQVCLFKKLTCFIDFFFPIVISVSFISCDSYFLLIFTLGFICSFFPLVSCDVKLGCLFEIFLVSWGQHLTLWNWLRTVFTISHKILHVHFHFHLFQEFFILFWILFWPISFSETCLIFTYLLIFQFSSYNWYLVFMPLCWEKTFDMISIFLNVLRLFVA